MEIQLNKILCSILFALYAITSSAQIEMFNESAQVEASPKAISYDSIRNVIPQPFGGKENSFGTFDHLIGQTLMYCGSPIYPNNLFKVGEYYKVIGTTLPNNISIFGGLKVENTNTGQVFEDNGNHQSYLNTYWVVVGYYEKLKESYLNKEFIYIGTDKLDNFSPGLKKNGLINLATDTVTKDIKKESLWTCVGVQVKPEKEIDRDNPLEYSRIARDLRNPVVLIFDNPVYGKHYCYYESEKGKPYVMQNSDMKPYICGRFQLKSDFDYMRAMAVKRKTQLVKQYGAKIADLIVQGFINVGMTKSMCREAWGKPENIHKTITSSGTYEMWSYGSCNLHFEGDRLTMIMK